MACGRLCATGSIRITETNLEQEIISMDPSKHLARIASVAAVMVFAAGGCTQKADVPDCDRDDRVKHETPDCGYVSKGRFVEWSWVKAGKTVPPVGWSAAKEKAAGPNKSVKR